MLDNLKAKLTRAHKSWTIWFNGAMLGAIPTLDYLHSSMHDIQQYVTADVYRYLGMALIAGNILLRFKTNTGLDEK